MLIYFLLYLTPAILALSWQSDIKVNHKQMFFWYGVGLFFTLVIGFRHEVGGDWYNYIRIFRGISYLTFNEALQYGDPAYSLLNWTLNDWGFYIYHVNIICASIFIIGLIIFSKRQPNPWLAMVVAVPYIVVVMSMGYTRQAVALGFIFMALNSLEKSKFKHFLIFVALATTFHKSAILMMGLGLFLQGNGKLVRFFAVIIVGYSAWSSFFSDQQQHLWDAYVTTKMQSQGAVIRVVMNLFPSMILLMLRKKWKQEFKDYSFWQMIALGSIISMFLVNFASTAVDRIALYFTPIQVIVYSRLPFLLRNTLSEKTTTFLIVAVYLLVLYVWLNYAAHSRFWLPYQNFLFI